MLHVSRRSRALIYGRLPFTRERSTFTTVHVRITGVYHFTALPDFTCGTLYGAVYLFYVVLHLPIPHTYDAHFISRAFTFLRLLLHVVPVTLIPFVVVVRAGYTLRCVDCYGLVLSLQAVPRIFLLYHSRYITDVYHSTISPPYRSLPILPLPITLLPLIYRSVIPRYPRYVTFTPYRFVTVTIPTGP